MIRFRLFFTLLVLLAGAPPVAAEILFAIGEPVAESSKSGIGQISGWAVSDIEITSVEAFIDGASLGRVPYGGTRQDVAAAFPDYPGSEFSGWAMKWNYSLLAEGEHMVTVVVTDIEGNYVSKDVLFTVTAFKSAFISDPALVRTAGADVSNPEDGRIVIDGAEIDGEIVDVELKWDTGSQQFLVNKITREEPVKQNQAPLANAGPNRTIETGEPVAIEGNASDPDGTITGYFWAQLSGTAVDLIDANKRIVKFTAPTQPGSIRLRFTVTDDDDATTTDDLVITVESPPPPPNEPPVANAGANQSVEQGEKVTLTGSGSDPDGTITGWNWQQISGQTVSISNANSQVATFTAPGNAGDIRLRLTVTDNNGATNTDDTIITVEAEATPDNTTGEEVPSMLSAINAARGEARRCGDTDYSGQDPLAWSSSLAEIARLHSMDMAREGYFSHTSLDGTTMGDRVFPYWSGTRVGENIAASSTNLSDNTIVKLWLESPGHCALIMDPDFTHAGIGAGHDLDNGYKYHHFWTLDFGG